jgi:hypothetical protein
MSRTAHHVPSRHRTVPAPWSAGLPGPCTAHELTDLRHARAESWRARGEGRRPVPARVTRSFATYTLARALRGRIRSPYESRARASLSTFRSTARNHLRAAPPGTLLEAAEALDHPPTRHRHRDLWEY